MSNRRKMKRRNYFTNKHIHKLTHTYICMYAYVRKCAGTVALWLWRAAEHTTQDVATFMLVALECVGALKAPRSRRLSCKTHLHTYVHIHMYGIICSLYEWHSGACEGFRMQSQTESFVHISHISSFRICGAQMFQHDLSRLSS